MKRLHAITWIAAAVAGTAVVTTSRADVRNAIGPREREVPVEQNALPTECRQFLDVPRDNTSELLVWDQKLSLAACRPVVSIEPVSTSAELQGMVSTLDNAYQPSMQMYRDAIARAPDEIKLVAAYQLGMTNVNTIVRARSAIQVANTGELGGATYGTQADFERARQLRDELDPLLARQHDDAHAAFAQVEQIAQSDPAAANANPVTAYVVAQARMQDEQLR